MNRRNALKHLSALAAASAVGPVVYAQSAPGQMFQALEPRVPQEATGKVEVIEFFHYGCPHCRAFDPLLEGWLKKLPKDVAFRRVPAIWGSDQLLGLARLHYAIEMSGLSEKLHPAVFVGVQDRKLPLHTEEGVVAWLGGFQVDAKAFMANYKAFGMGATLKRAEQTAAAYKVKGVPTMAVGGRFVTSASMTGTHEKTLQVVDELIAKARA